MQTNHGNNPNRAQPLEIQSMTVCAMSLVSFAASPEKLACPRILKLRSDLNTQFDP